MSPLDLDPSLSELKHYNVLLRCVYCRHVIDTVRSTYPGDSHGICKSAECQKQHKQAMDSARRRK